jgi:hypothetical protein
MRTLFKVLVDKKEEAVRTMIKEKIDDLSLSKLQQMLGSSSEVTSHASHSIIQTSCPKQPKSIDDDNYLKDDAVVRCISSSAVLESLYGQFGGKLFVEQSILLNLFRAIPETAATAGNLWEPRGHVRFFKGDRFTLVRMKVNGPSLIQSGEERTITIKPMTPTLLDPKSVCSPEKYYIPATKNHLTFDACFLLEQEQIALQFTISLKHSINDKGFPVLKSVLPTGCDEQALVFVVPKSRAEKFKTQAPSSGLQKGFQYYVLSLDDGGSEYCPSSADT